MIGRDSIGGSTKKKQGHAKNLSNIMSTPKGLKPNILNPSPSGAESCKAKFQKQVGAKAFTQKIEIYSKNDKGEIKLYDGKQTPTPQRKRHETKKSARGDPLSS